MPALEVIEDQRWPVRVVGQALTGVRVTAEPRVVGSTAIVLANPHGIHLTLIDRWIVQLTLTGNWIAVPGHSREAVGSATIVLTDARCIHLTLIDRWIVRFALTGVRTAVEARVCGSATVVAANPRCVPLTLIDRWIVWLTLTAQRIAVEAGLVRSATIVLTYARCIHLTIIDRWIVWLTCTGNLVTMEPSVVCSTTRVLANAHIQGAVLTSGGNTVTALITAISSGLTRKWVLSTFEIHTNRSSSLIQLNCTLWVLLRQILTEATVHLLILDHSLLSATDTTLHFTALIRTLWTSDLTEIVLEDLGICTAC